TASDVLLKILGSPNIASKRWVFEQYDTMVRTNTVVGPGSSDAAVVRLKDSEKGLAVKTDCNSKYVYLNPRKGAQIAVAEAARNVVCAGGKPVAITNCLNFGNPYKPEQYWVFKEAVSGMGEACRAFNTPVTGGNVSFYNENPEGAVYPTPTIGMLGVVEDVKQHATAFEFKQEGDLVLELSPEAQPQLGIEASEYLTRIHGVTAGDAPSFTMEGEIAVQEACLSLIRLGLVQSAHDVSDGGMAVSLAEMCLASDGLGADINLDASNDQRLDSALFSEAQSRIILAVRPEKFEKIRQSLDGFSVQLKKLGVVVGDGLTIAVAGEPVISASSAGMHKVYENAIPDLMSNSL
ncbi:MAG: phosphoribosylformylglycinamidine synthase subunit PurL, partial [Bacteroidetes Order II. Incertae sedis bacterium]|nr:phosphoribosylformylglycinamidine synthase subunit PurL [Bacteroidetes Order II. bacterium]